MENLREKLVSLSMVKLWQITRYSLNATGQKSFDFNRDVRTKSKSPGVVEFLLSDAFPAQVVWAGIRKFSEAAKPEAAKVETQGETKVEAAKPETVEAAKPEASPANINRIAEMLAGLLATSTDEASVRKIAGEVCGEAVSPLTDHMAVLAAAIKELEEAGKHVPTRVIIENRFEQTETDLGIQHAQFADLCNIAMCRDNDGHGLNVWLAGPAGSGKTTAARMVSKAANVAFYFNGAIDSEYKLLGFTDAQGRIVSRPFREAWTNGGVYLFDEVDASMPGALLAFNAALANGWCDFPDGCVKRHPDCYIIAAANTWGCGPNADYVGRLKQDGAFLDRFVPLYWGYDEDLELALCGNKAWCRKVQKYRAKADQAGLKVIISPRATQFGAALLASGKFTEERVAEMVIKKGMTAEQWSTISR